MKGVFVVLDGVADEPCRLLGHITPLQAARTPNLDSIAKESEINYTFPVKEGIAPEASSAIISLLGYDSSTISRGILEAIGSDVKLTRGDLAFRTNFATLEDLDSGNVLDRRAGRTLTVKEARVLANAVNKGVKLPFPFEFKPTLHHRGVLVFRGGFSDNITNIDPHYGDGVVSHKPSMKISFSHPMDEEEDSKVSSGLVNNFVKQSHKILEKHPINRSRFMKGLYSTNFILCRGAGCETPKLKKLKGVEKGIARSCNMQVYKFNYPQLKGMDVYANLNSGLRKAIRGAIRMLKKYKNKHDYFFIHFKETDFPGHDNKPFEKVKMIELLDRRFFSFLKGFLNKNEIKLVITSDYTTSCRMKSHTKDSVPVLIYPGSKDEEEDKRFTEQQGLQGRKMVGRKILEKTLFVKRSNN